MSKAEEMRAAAQRRRERRAQPVTERAMPAAAPVRVKPVRRTVDLDPQAHRDLGRWCDDAALTLGATRITGQDVLATLVTRLLQNDELAQAVRDDLATELHRRAVTRATTT